MPQASHIHSMMPQTAQSNGAAPHDGRRPPSLRATLTQLESVSESEARDGGSSATRAPPVILPVIPL